MKALHCKLQPILTSDTKQISLRVAVCGKPSTVVPVHTAVRITEANFEC